MKLVVDNKIILKNSKISLDSFCIIAGPCVVENKDKLFRLAKKLKDIGVTILRGGTFKMRTSPTSFQGLGEKGLKILHEVGKTLKLDVVSEITSIDQVKLFEKYTDIIMVGMRNMFNYPLLEKLALVKQPIIIKRNFSAKLSETLDSLSYLTSKGKKNIILCERGIRTFEDSTRNTLDITGISLLKSKYPDLLVICDPSHASGHVENIENLAMSSIFSGFNGTIIEVDENPSESLSDSNQILDIESFDKTYNRLNKTFNFYKSLDETKN
jgi:3-deoxy-7-phosphoheptulonate synthase